MRAMSIGLGTIDMDWCPYEAVAARVDREEEGGEQWAWYYIPGLMSLLGIGGQCGWVQCRRWNWAGCHRYELMSLRGSDGPLGLWTVTMMSCRLGPGIMSNRPY